ncbi:hypothetical protein [Streptomyces sp. NPDC012746]|uniref:hypothetical protein n=1 Tax=Streptomyces sp. NPDC012746 TaxID=3364845 RepID=UPI0036A64662
MASKIAADWYAHYLEDPGDAYTEWQQYGVAVLPLGEWADAVRLPEVLVHAFVASDTTADVNVAVAEVLEGPVIHDARGRNYYAFVPPGTAPQWHLSHLGVECLSHGTHLGVPDISQDRPSPRRPIYWAACPEAKRFCHMASVGLLVRIGTARLAEDGGSRIAARPPAAGYGQASR